MQSFTVSTEIEIDAPAAEVWAIVATYDRDPEWRDGVVTMDPSTHGIVEPGTTTAEELHMGGSVWRNRGEVLTVEPGRSFTWHSTEGAEANGDRRIESIGPNRSRVSMTIAVTEPGLATLDDAVVESLRDAMQEAITGDGVRLRDLVTRRLART